MAVTVNVHQAKTNFSKLLGRVAMGEEVIIAKAGKPVARLVPIREKPAQRVLGLAKGRIWVAPDFDAPLPEEIIAEFENMEDFER